MTDQLEAATEALPQEIKIKLATPESYAVTALAIYGVTALTRDVTGKVKQIMTDRKAKKAAKIETDATILKQS